MADVFNKLGETAPAEVPVDITLEKWAELKTGKAVSGGGRIKGDGLLVEPRKFRRKRVMEFLVTKA